MKLTAIPLTIGGVTVVFKTRSKKMSQAIRHRYRGYTKSSKKVQLTIKVVWTRGYFKKTGPIVSTGGEGDLYTVAKGDFKCHWRGGIGEAHLHESIFSFDGCLRIILATLVVHHGGFLLHSSAIVSKGRAYVFSGKSEAGKTTIARLSGKKILNDEIIAVKRQASGKIHVYGTPFWGKKGTGPAYPTSYPLEGIYFLNKSSEVYKVKQEVFNCLPLFLQVVCYFDQKPQNVQRLMDLCFQIMQGAPLYKLYFAKNRQFLKVL